jgi:hypothetical protein
MLRGRGVETISAPMSAHHPNRNVVEKIGFRERESVPVVLSLSPYLRQAFDASTTMLQLMAGDRDS